MKREIYKKYLLFGAVLMAMLSLPALFVENVRSHLIALISPIWKTCDSLFYQRQEGKETFYRLEIENHLLQNEVDRLKSLLDYQLEIDSLETTVLPARVIYRDPSSWTSSLWINVGEETNARLGRKIVEKNSPVVLGKCLVGVIDFVGKKESLVRLITDVAINPSVRVVRENLSLAKGVVHGAGKPKWRSLNHILKGIGFNYDFPDSEGPAHEPGIALLRVGDVLVTTGMDGVFPKGLYVGIVTKVYPLHEGATTFALDAKPAVTDLDNLHMLFVLSSLGEREKKVE